MALSVLPTNTSSSSLQTCSSISSPGWDDEPIQFVQTPATELSNDPDQPISDNFVLVVGGLGYIGSHTSWELLKSGQNVIIVDNLANANSTVLDNLIKLRNDYYASSVSRPILDFYQIDYRSRDQMREMLEYYEDFEASYLRVRSSFKSRIVGVIHFAAYKAVAESFKKPLDYYGNNVSGLIDFCTLLAEFKIKNIVFSSSATVYGELANAGGRLYEQQCDSSGCSGLTNPYGRTKWMCEAILSDLANSDPTWKIVSLRYFNPIGCDESGRLGEEPRSVASNLMPVVVRAMTGEIPQLSIFGSDWDTPDGTAIRDFIHVSDLAEGHLAALKAMTSQLSTGYHVFNLGTGSGHSVREIVTTMEQISQRTIPTQLTSRREGDVGMCIADTSKSTQTLQWSTQRTLARACWDICRYIGYVKDSYPEKPIAPALAETPATAVTAQPKPITLIDQRLKEITIKAGTYLPSRNVLDGRPRSRTMI